MSTGTQADDASVKNAILTALGKMGVEHVRVRPNKLRKIVCRQIEGATWTQFSECLEAMIEHGDIRVGSNEDGERMILLAEREEKGETEKAERWEKATLTLSIPLAVALHLKRKGHLKQKNIEQTTKTKLSMSTADMTATEKQTDHDAEGVTLTVAKEYSYSTTDEKSSASEAEASAKKQLKAASVLIDNMIKGYRKHPDHFATRRGGGSFQEQEDARKKKEEGTKRRDGRHREKRRGGGSGGDATGPIVNRQVKQEGSGSNTKKGRKFY